MDENLNKIQSLSKRLNSLQGNSYGKHELFNNKKMTDKVNLYARHSMKMNGRAEDNNPVLLKNKALNPSRSKSPPQHPSFKKNSSPSKSISSVNSVTSMKKYSKNYFSPASLPLFYSESTKAKEMEHILLLNNLKTLKNK